MNAAKDKIGRPLFNGATVAHCQTGERAEVLGTVSKNRVAVRKADGTDATWYADNTSRVL